jgi:hypothetical protein
LIQLLHLAPVMEAIYKNHPQGERELILTCGVDEVGYTNDRKITIDWSDNTESDFDYYLFGTKFNLYHRPVSNSEYLGNITPGNNPYYYSVIAVDELGNMSEPSYCGNVILDTQAPPVPELLSPEDGSIISNKAFTQRWTSDEDDYIYHYESCFNDPDESEGVCDLKHPGTYTTNKKKVGAGQPDSHFWWRVRSEDRAGNLSDWSESFELIIDASAPVTTFLSPSSGVRINQPIVLWGKTVDDRAMGSVNIYVRETSEIDWVLLETLVHLSGSETFEWMYEWTPEGYECLSDPDGCYFDIKAVGEDLVGNVETVTENSLIKPAMVDEFVKEAGYENPVYNINYDPNAPLFSMSDLVITEPLGVLPDYVVENNPEGFGVVCSWNVSDISDLELSPNEVDRTFSAVSECYVEDLAGNRTYDTFDVKVNNDPIVSVEIIDNSNNTLSATVIGGSTPLSFLWSGDCSGVVSTVNKPTEAGSYSCTLLVTDIDGDTASDTYQFSVISQGVVQGTNTVINQTNTVDPLTYNALQDSPENETEDDENDVLGEETVTNDKSLGGANSCDVKVELDGIVYADNDKDGKQGEKEKGLRDVVVEVYYTEGNSDVVVAEATSGKDGSWSVEVCPGKYKLRVDSETVPNGYELVEAIDIEVDEEDTSLANIGIGLERSSSLFSWLNWKWLLLIIVILLGGYVVVSRKKEL